MRVFYQYPKCTFGVVDLYILLLTRWKELESAMQGLQPTASNNWSGLHDCLVFRKCLLWGFRGFTLVCFGIFAVLRVLLLPRVFYPRFGVCIVRVVSWFTCSANAFPVYFSIVSIAWLCFSASPIFYDCMCLFRDPFAFCHLGLYSCRQVIITDTLHWIPHVQKPTPPTF